MNLKFTKDQHMLTIQLITQFQISVNHMKSSIHKTILQMLKNNLIMKSSHLGNKILMVKTQETISSQILVLMRKSNMLKMVLHGLKKILITFGLQLKMPMATGTSLNQSTIVHTLMMVTVVSLII